MASPSLLPCDSASLDNVPPAFLCPISYKLMLDPVILLQSGQSYERDSINEWLKRGSTMGSTNDPVTGINLRTTAMTTNWALRDVIRQWASDNGHPLPPPMSPGFYNRCLLIGELDGSVAVVFDDGDFDPAVPFSQILPRTIGGVSSDSPQTLSIGSLCWAPYLGKSDCIYPGRILGVTKVPSDHAPEPSIQIQTVAVLFDDGDRDDRVPLHGVYLDTFDESNAWNVEVEGSDLEIGARVFATYQGSTRVYPGVITHPLVPAAEALPTPSNEARGIDVAEESDTLDDIFDANGDLNPPPLLTPRVNTVIVAYDDGDFDDRVPLDTIQFFLPAQHDPYEGRLGRRCCAPWHGSTRLWDGRVLTEEEAWKDVALKLNLAIQGMKLKTRRALDGRRGSQPLNEAYMLAKQVQWLRPGVEEERSPAAARSPFTMLSKIKLPRVSKWMIGMGCGIVLGACGIAVVVQRKLKR